MCNCKLRLCFQDFSKSPNPPGASCVVSHCVMRMYRIVLCACNQTLCIRSCHSLVCAQLANNCVKAGAFSATLARCLCSVYRTRVLFPLPWHGRTEIEVLAVTLSTSLCRPSTQGEGQVHSAGYSARPRRARIQATPRGQTGRRTSRCSPRGQHSRGGRGWSRAEQATAALVYTTVARSSCCGTCNE